MKGALGCYKTFILNMYLALISSAILPKCTSPAETHNATHMLRAPKQLQVGKIAVCCWHAINHGIGEILGLSSLDSKTGIMYP
jgi:hypothetical protein